MHGMLPVLGACATTTNKSGFIETMILPFSQVYVLALVLGHPDSIERSEEERRQFWLHASLREQRVEVDTLTLPPLSFSYGGPRVAICVTGQVRTMPFILKTLKLNIVDALGANTTDIFYVVDLEAKKRRGRVQPFACTSTI